MIETREGNLFEQPDLQALGHGVNCVGKMGAGIALEFRRRFPEMHEHYVETCRQKKLKLGQVMPWHDNSGLYVFNMASQFYTGRDARMDALISCVDKVIDYCEHREIQSLGLPQIGCGIGGLDWAEVEPAIAKRAADTEVKIVLVTFAPAP